MDRKANYKQGGISSAAAGTDRRRQQELTGTKQRREALLRSKRLRKEPSDEVGQEVAAEMAGGGTITAAAVRQAVTALQNEKAIGSGPHLAALQRLRRLMSTDDETPCRVAAEAGAVPLLIKALQPAGHVADAANAAVTALEGAWALTNMAAADHNVAAAVLPAAPGLILLLSGQDAPIAQQAAWALGNLAGDCADFRMTLVANGVLQPLAGLAVSPVAPGAAASSTQVAAAATGAWALSNVLKGAGSEIGHLLAIHGVTEALVALLGFDDANLASEAAWVSTYLTAGSEGHITRLVEAGLVSQLLQRLVTSLSPPGVPPLSTEAVGKADRTLLTPLLRTVGNVAAGGGEKVVAAVLNHENGIVVPCVLALMGSSHHGLSKEAAWAISNIAGAPGRAGINAIAQAQGVPIIMDLLKRAPFDIRKEVAYALANICAGGGGGKGDPNAVEATVGRDQQALEAMLDLIRAPDMEAAQLGVQFAEMVLRILPNGPQAVEAADGIDALESIQFRGPSDMQQLATELLDHYFGEDYGL